MKQKFIFLRANAEELNNKFTYKFERGIKINSYIIKNFYCSNIMSKIFIHCPQLIRRTVNNSVINGDNSDVIGFYTNSPNSNMEFLDERFTNYLNQLTDFHELTFYFTSDAKNSYVNPTDFVLILSCNNSPNRN